jgi:hydroxymethylpyrimidine pyrophosphatase-like HAD family hydrolase
MATDTTPEPPLPRVSDIKLIVSDVDGTLLDSHHELQSSNPTHIVLRRIRQAHPSLPIVLSTGKPYPATAVLRDQLDLHPFHAVHLNGNVIYAPSNPVTKEEGKILSQTGLDADVVLAVYDTLKKAGISLFIYDVGGPWHVLPFKTVGDIPWDVALRAYGEDVQTIDRAEEAMARVKNGEFKVVKMAVCEVAEYLPSTFFSFRSHSSKC